MSKCKGCRAEILWIETATGKLMPIDVKPKKVFRRNERGHWVLIEGYESHFATCPKADQFRKPKKK